MGKYIIITALLLSAVSCSTTRTADSPAASRRAARAEATRIAVENSIMSGNYLIKMERLDAGRGFTTYLTPDFNYIIVDQGIVRMKLGYIGRQYDFRGIAAINMSGKASGYEVVRDADKKRYEINLKASQAGEQFFVYMSVDDRGQCRAVVVNARIESVRYSGKLFIPPV